MKKITDLTERRFRTTYTKDSRGNRVRGREEYIAKRKVRTINPGPRFGHFFIDLICFRLVIMGIQYIMQMIQIATGTDNFFGLTFAYFSSITIFFLYPSMYFVCEYLWQQTPGKLLTKTVVIDEYGNKPSIRHVMLRSLIRLVPFEPLTCLGEPSHGWHDRWSETFVVRTEELNKLKELQEQQS